MAAEIPAVSVIIPMYNVEKYIAETLDSVFAQTLKNFELIVIDNGSTDNSAAIVKSFIPKFEGRLKLLHMKENTGGPSIPRNKGLELSRGKYIYFFDSDDVIFKNTLELFYNAAEHYQADVLFADKYFVSSGVGENFLKDTRPLGDLKNKTIKVLSENLNARLYAWADNAFEVYPWLKFVRRDFLIDNEIKFLPVIQEDSYWTLELVCLAKKAVIVPYMFYVHRQYSNSFSTTTLNRDFNVESIYKKLDRIIHGLKHLEKFLNGVEFFRQNPKYSYTVLNLIVAQNVDWIYRAYREFPRHLVYEKIKDALTKDTEKFDVLISCLIGYSINLLERNATLQEKINQLEKSTAPKGGN